MTSYFKPLRKTIRWCHKVLFQHLLGTAVVNSLIIYKELTRNNIQASNFRQQIIEELVKSQDCNLVSSSSRKHKLIETDEKQG